MRSALHLLIVSMAVTPLVPTLGAQDLNTLPVADRRIELGAERTGSLSAGDFAMPDGSFAQAWELAANGRTVTIDLLSDAFDAYLLLVGPGITEPLSNDDGAGGCHARITHTLAQTGAYRIIVNSVGSGSEGTFILRVSDIPPPPSDAPCLGGPAPETPPQAADTAAYRALPRAGAVAVGDSVTATLASTDPITPEGRQVQVWELPTRPGMTVTIDVLSADFDAYLTVLAAGSPQTIVDDDGAGYCDARVRLDANAEGVALLMVSALSGDDGGTYALRLRAEPPPPAPERCRAPRVAASALAALEVAGTLRIEETVEGELSTEDPMLQNDTRARVYELTAGAGVPFTVDLISDVFDAYLYLTGPGLSRPLSDDDGGGRCNARIVVGAPRGGTYRIIVSSFAEAGGAFTLRATEEPPPAMPGECGGGLEPSIAEALEAIPPQGTLSMEGEGNGTITEGDSRVAEDGPYAHVWELPGRAGASVTIDVITDAFDAFALVVGPGLGLDAMDDDCGGGTNPRLAVTFPEDGAYRVVVTTFSPGETGPYMVFVTPGADPQALACASEESPDVDELLSTLDALPVNGSIEVGSEIEGTLGIATSSEIEGSYVMVYEMAGEPGSSVTVDLVSDAFDAILILTGPGIPGLETNDDGAGACNARLTVSFPETGTYRVIASSVSPGSTGAFVLRVTAEPGPVDPAPCG